MPVDNSNEYKLTSWNGEKISEDEETDAYHTTKSLPGLIGKDAKIIRTATITITKDELESIKKYGGFYIGRYEASYNETSQKIESKKNKIPYTNNTLMKLQEAMNQKAQGNAPLEGLSINDMSQWRVEKIAVRGAADGSNTNNIPNMVSGRQWDAMIRWLNQTNGTSYNTIGHTGSSKIATGSNDNYKVNNIYDIAGNIAEYVTGEFYGKDNLSVYRGGNYTLSTLSANMRSNNNGTAEENIGTRLAIVLSLPQNDNTIENRIIDNHLAEPML